MTRMPFKAFSTSGISLTGYMALCRSKVNKPTTMPVDEMSTGYINEHQSLLKSGDDAAKEPKRSAPIPAMSPTLSPTLSAMHAGFL